MTTFAHRRTRLVVLLITIVLSAACMLWLFWRFPVITAVTALIVLTGFGVSARVARLIDIDQADLKRRNQRV